MLKLFFELAKGLLQTEKAKKVGKATAKGSSVVALAALMSTQIMQHIDRVAERKDAEAKQLIKDMEQRQQTSMQMHQALENDRYSMTISALNDLKGAVERTESRVWQFTTRHAEIHPDRRPNSPGLLSAWRNGRKESGIKEE